MADLGAGRKATRLLLAQGRQALPRGATCGRLGPAAGSRAWRVRCNLVVTRWTACGRPEIRRHRHRDRRRWLRQRAALARDGAQRNVGRVLAGRAVAGLRVGPDRTFRVYVRPYPGPGTATQVSFEGGTSPAWNPGGKELFFLSESNQAGGRKMMAVEFDGRTTFGRPTPLFDFDPAVLRIGCTPNRCFGVAPDGQHFYAVAGHASSLVDGHAHQSDPKLVRGAEGERAGEAVGAWHAGSPIHSLVRHRFTPSGDHGFSGIEANAGARS